MAEEYIDWNYAMNNSLTSIILPEMKIHSLSILLLYYIRIATNVYGLEVLEEEFSISKKLTYVLIKTVL